MGVGSFPSRSHRGSSWHGYSTYQTENDVILLKFERFCRKALNFKGCNSAVDETWKKFFKWLINTCWFHFSSENCQSFYFEKKSFLTSLTLNRCHGNISWYMNSKMILKHAQILNVKNLRVSIQWSLFKFLDLLFENEALRLITVAFR